MQSRNLAEVAYLKRTGAPPLQAVHALQWPNWQAEPFLSSLSGDSLALLRCDLSLEFLELQGATSSTQHRLTIQDHNILPFFTEDTDGELFLNRGCTANGVRSTSRENEFNEEELQRLERELLQAGAPWPQTVRPEREMCYDVLSAIE